MYTNDQNNRPYSYAIRIPSQTISYFGLSIDSGEVAAMVGGTVFVRIAILVDATLNAPIVIP